MPSDLKKAATALAFSLVAFYLDGLLFEGLSISDAVTLGIYILWGFVIPWLIWDLFKGNDIRVALVGVEVIIFASLVWDVSQSGAGTTELFDVLELIMFGVAYFFVNTNESKSWFSQHKS